MERHGAIDKSREQADDKETGDSQPYEGAATSHPA